MSTPPTAGSVPVILPARTHAWTAREGWLYAAAAGLSLLLVYWVMDLGRADLRVPFDYEGDGVFNVALVKGIVENGWYAHNDALGAPAGLRLDDYPVGDNLCCVIMKGMTLFTSDPVLIVNVFFLLTFPLVALGAMHALRGFNVSAGPALLASVLYALLPYHFWRGTTHLYFSAYFLVPSAVLLAWWVATGALLGHRRRLVFAGVIAVLLGCNMIYYPFFACYLIGIAGLMALLGRRDRRHFVAAAALVTVVAGVVLLNLLPTILHRNHVEVSKRPAEQSEMFAFKIAQLVLPVTGHRIAAWAELKNRYNVAFTPVNENDWVSLGVLGSAGFLTLIGWSLFAWRRSGREETGPGAVLDHLSAGNLAAVLLGTLGGFSALFALLVSPQLRGYNRIGVFVAFYALLALAIVLDRAREWWVRSGRGPVAFGLGLTLLGGLGVLDQTGVNARRDWSGLKTSFRFDHDFFTRVQAAVPAGAMVFELPYEPFPEYGQTMNKMIEYALFRPYLHTRGLRWSYGVLKGEPGDAWERATAAQPPAKMVETLRHAGFAGIYLDRFAYADRAAVLEADLRASLNGAAPLVCGQGRLAFFPFDPSTVAASPPALETILPLPTPEWKVGFYDLETAADQQTSWRWCAARGELHLRNDGVRPRRVRLSALLRNGSPGTSNLRVHGGGLPDEELSLDPGGKDYTRVFDLPPGSSVVRFESDGKPATASPGDPRTLVWRLDNFSLENAD